MGIARKCEGKTYLFRGTFRSYVIEHLRDAITKEEGRLATELDESVDVLVVGDQERCSNDLEQRARRRGVDVVEEVVLTRSLLPTRDEAIELLRGGAPEHSRFNVLVFQGSLDTWQRELDGEDQVDLSGADLAGLDLSGLQIGVANLDGADLRRTTLRGSRLPAKMQGTKLDGAELDLVALPSMTDCTLRKASLKRCGLPTGRDSLERVDLTGADLSGATGSLCSMRDCTAVGANFAEANLRFERLDGTDLKNAIFRDAWLIGSDFTGADLAGADFSGAVLSEAVFESAELAGTTFENAKVGYARFEGALLSDADFTGAFVGGASFASSEALLGEDSAGLARAGSPGSCVAELTSVVDRAVRVDMTLSLGLPDGQVAVELEAHGKGQGYTRRVHSTWRVQTSGRSMSESANAKTLGEHMHAFARRYGFGEAGPESLRVRAKKSPTKGKALKDLAIRAWCEVLGADEASFKKKRGSGTKKKRRKQPVSKPPDSAVTPEQWEGRAIETRGLRDFVFSDDHRRLVALYVRDGRGIVDVHRCGSPEVDRQIKVPGSRRSEPACLAVSPDGRLLAVGTPTVRLMDLQTGKTIGSLKGHKQQVRGVAFSPDGTQVATTSGDNWTPADWAARVWDAVTFQEVARLKLGAIGSAVAFCPGGRELVVACERNWSEPLRYREAKIWDLSSRTGRELEYYEARYPGYSTLAVSPDGKWIVGGSNGRFTNRGALLAMWDAHTGAFVREIGTTSWGTSFVRFANSGRVLVSVHEDYLALWSSDGFEQIARLDCERATVFGDDAHIARIVDGTIRVLSIEDQVASAQATTSAESSGESTARVVRPADAPLSGLRVTVLGNVIDPSARRFYKQKELRDAVASLGGEIAPMHEDGIDVALVGLGAHQDREAYDLVVERELPILNSAAVIAHLSRERRSPDLTDAVGALLRFARRQRAHPDVEVRLGMESAREPMMRHQTFGWGNVVSVALERASLRLPRQLVHLLESLGKYSVRWQEDDGVQAAGINLSPALSGSAEDGVLEHRTTECDGCPHLVLDVVDDASVAVFRRDYEGSRVFCWSNRDPESLTALAEDLYSYVVLAVENEGRPLWQLAVARPDLV